MSAENADACKTVKTACGCVYSSVIILYNDESVPKAHLCKGRNILSVHGISTDKKVLSHGFGYLLGSLVQRELSAQLTEGLSAAVRIRRRFSLYASACRAIPPARLMPTHLPLHKGGVGVCKVEHWLTGSPTVKNFFFAHRL